MSADPYGLTREELAGCLRAFYRNRHKKRPLCATGRRSAVLTSCFRAYRDIVRHYIRRIRAVDEGNA